MTENEFLLEDRKQKIRQIIYKYGEDKFYVSYSGGFDSVVLSALIDIAIPGNKIPRVYSDTGIEYKMIREFVEKVKNSGHSWELVIIKPTVPIRKMLETVGYPFKSKKHAQFVSIYQKYKTLENRIGLQHYLHISNDGVEWSPQNSCPKVLRYQFTPEFTLPVSDKCCDKLKKEPLEKWEKENNRPYSIVGIRREEGGRRISAQCLAFESGKFKRFQPLAPMTKEWEKWFVNKYSINYCDIYKPPYSFIRTGCKGCPFAIGLQNELDTLEEFFPEERKQCEYIWAPVYSEYRRLGYRLKKPERK